MISNFPCELASNKFFNEKQQLIFLCKDLISSNVTNHVSLIKTKLETLLPEAKIMKDLIVMLS